MQSSLTPNLEDTFTGALYLPSGLNIALARANSILDHNNNDGNSSFLSQILVPITQRVFETKKSKTKVPIPSVNNIYTRLFQKRVQLIAGGGVRVELGGLAVSSGVDFAQADAATNTIHLNTDWMNKISKIRKVDESGDEARRHHAMLVCKLLHEYLLLYIRHIITFFHECHGTRISKTINMDTPEEIGRKVATGGEMMFGGRTYFRSPKTDPFRASLPTSFALINSEGGGVEFIDRNAEMAWVNTILEAALPEAIDLATIFRPTDEAVEPLLTCKAATAAPAAAVGGMKRKRKSAASSAEPQEEVSPESEVPSDSDEWGWQHVRALPLNKHFKS